MADVIVMNEERKRQILLILSAKYPEQFELPEDTEEPE